jgi:hypothetical protein
MRNQKGGCSARFIPRARGDAGISSRRPGRRRQQASLERDRTKRRFTGWQFKFCPLQMPRCLSSAQASNLTPQAKSETFDRSGQLGISIGVVPPDPRTSAAGQLDRITSLRQADPHHCVSEIAPELGPTPTGTGTSVML